MIYLSMFLLSIAVAGDTKAVSGDTKAPAIDTKAPAGDTKPPTEDQKGAFCLHDLHQYCPGIDDPTGRVKCLDAHSAKLRPACVIFKDVMVACVADYLRLCTTGEKKTPFPEICIRRELAVVTPECKKTFTEADPKLFPKPNSVHPVAAPPAAGGTPAAQPVAPQPGK
jgi:hypothetical protein